MSERYLRISCPWLATLRGMAECYPPLSGYKDVPRLLDALELQVVSNLQQRQKIGNLVDTTRLELAFLVFDADTFEREYGIKIERPSMTDAYAQTFAKVGLVSAAFLDELEQIADEVQIPEVMNQLAMAREELQDHERLLAISRRLIEARTLTANNLRQTLAATRANLNLEQP